MESCARANRQLSDSFAVASGVRQGCVFTPIAFITGMDWVLGRATYCSMCETAIGTNAFLDLNYADDVALLAELLDLLHLTLEIFDHEVS